MRWGFFIGAAVLVAGVGVWQRDALWPRLKAALPVVPSTSVTLPAAGPAAATQARKCRLGNGTVVYTDGACPAGARELPLDGGSLSVLPSAPRPPEPAASAPSAPDRARVLDSLR
ncbi:MAG: hypothetical protein U1F56_07095 [Rubrivivax sp.]